MQAMGIEISIERMRKTAVGGSTIDATRAFTASNVAAT